MSNLFNCLAVRGSSFGFETTCVSYTFCFNVKSHVYGPRTESDMNVQNAVHVRIFECFFFFSFIFVMSNPAYDEVRRRTGLITLTIETINGRGKVVSECSNRALYFLFFHNAREPCRKLSEMTSRCVSI